MFGHVMGLHIPLGDLVGSLKLLSLGDFPEGLSLGVHQKLWVAKEFESNFAPPAELGATEMS